VESEVIAEVDWEYTKRDLALPPDECQAIEAGIGDLNLQAAEAPEELGPDAHDSAPFGDLWRPIAGGDGASLDPNGNYGRLAKAAMP
jgi:hypothetical protein